MEENPTPSKREAWQEDGFAGSGNQNDEISYLRDLTSCEDLREATSLKIVVNSRNATISHLGRNLPNLIELNLSTSIMESIRDIGTGFQLLQVSQTPCIANNMLNSYEKSSIKVLWVPRCGLDSLDGISALPALRELYASYNDIADLQPLADSCPDLEVLDLECNQVSDLDALEVLSSGCPSLQSLNLTGCPLSQMEGFRGLARKAIPSLVSLDDAPINVGGDVDATCRVSTLPPPFHPPKLSLFDSEIHFVQEGIKHARVGVDSHEFRELEIALTVAASSPSSTLSPMNNVIAGDESTSSEMRSQLTLQQLTAVASSSILPASASSWMRCSQQGSLPGMSSVTQQGLGNNVSRLSVNSSGLESRASTASGGSRPSSVLLSAGDPGLVARSNSSSMQRPMTNSSRPFSARPNASGASSSHGRPPTSSLIGGGLGSSAPPTAGGGGGGQLGGLYWKKNRVNAVDHSSADGYFKGGGGGLEDDEEDAASTLTFGGEAALVGGGLARDLRRRRNQQQGGGGGGKTNRRPSPPGTQGSLLDAFPQPSSQQGSKGGSEAQEGWAVKRSDGSEIVNQARHQKGRGERPSSSVSTSFDSEALLNELRRWKVETADVALMPAEEEEGGLMDGAGNLGAWPGASEGEGEGEGEGEAKVDVLNFDEAESRTSRTSPTMEGLEPLPMVQVASLPAALGLSINTKPVLGTNLRPPSALGRPPLSPMPSLSPHRTGSFKASAGDATFEEGKFARPLTPGRNGLQVGLAPVLGARPVRPSKMILQKAIMDAFPGRVVCKTISSAASLDTMGNQMELIQSLSLKGRPSESLLSGKVKVALVIQGREVDLTTLNPAPRAWVSQDLEHSDEF